MELDNDKSRVQKYIEQELDFSLGESTGDTWVPALAARVNEMILHDFQRLMAILYRLDVSELKLKKMLNEEADTDAGTIIARLIIERQMQKQRTWQHFHRDDPGNEADDNERW